MDQLVKKRGLLMPLMELLFLGFMMYLPEKYITKVLKYLSLATSQAWDLIRVPIISRTNANLVNNLTLLVNWLCVASST